MHSAHGSTRSSASSECTTGGTSMQTAASHSTLRPLGWWTGAGFSQERRWQRRLHRPRRRSDVRVCPPPGHRGRRGTSGRRRTGHRVDRDDRPRNGVPSAPRDQGRRPAGGPNALPVPFHRPSPRSPSPRSPSPRSPAHRRVRRRRLGPPRRSRLHQPRQLRRPRTPRDMITPPNPADSHPTNSRRATKSGRSVGDVPSEFEVVDHLPGHVAAWEAPDIPRHGPTALGRIIRWPWSTGA